MPAPKDDRSVVEAVGDGLTVKEGDTVLERWGPLVALVLYVGLVLLLSFDVLPDPSPVVALMGLLGPVVGVYVRHMGRL